MGLTQYLKTVRDRQWFQIIRVQLAGVGPSVRLGQVDNDEVGPHQTDPVVSLDVHRHRPHPGSQHPGPVLPYQDHGAEVGNLTNIKDVRRGEDTKLRQMVFSEFLQTKVTLNFNSSSLMSNLNEERCRLIVEMEISSGSSYRTDGYYCPEISFSHNLLSCNNYTYRITSLSPDPDMAN